MTKDMMKEKLIVYRNKIEEVANKVKNTSVITRGLCTITALSLILSSFSITSVMNANQKLDELYVMEGTNGEGLYYLTDYDVNSISGKVESKLTDYFQKEFDEKSLSLSKNNTDMVKSIGQNIQGELENLAVTDDYITKAELDSIINGIVTKVQVDYKLTDKNKIEIENIAASASYAGLEEIKETVALLEESVDSVDAATQENAVDLGDVKSDATDALTLSNSNSTEISNLKVALADLQSENLNNLSTIRDSIYTLQKADLTSSEGLNVAVKSIDTLQNDLEKSTEFLSSSTSQSINDLITKLEENVDVLNKSINSSNGSLTEQISLLTTTVTTQIVELEKVQSHNLDTLAEDLQSQINSLDLTQEENKTSVTSKINEIDATLEELHTNDAISSSKYDELSNTINEMNTALTNSDGKLAEQIGELASNITNQIADLEKGQTSNLDNLANDLQSQINELDLSQAENISNVSTKIDAINQELEELHNKDAISSSKYDELLNAIKEMNNVLTNSDGELSDQIGVLAANMSTQIADLEKVQTSNLDNLASDLQSQIDKLDLSQAENVSNVSTKIDAISLELEELHKSDAISNSKYDALSQSLSSLKTYTDGELYNISLALEETKQMITDTNSNLDSQIESVSTNLSASMSKIENRMEKLESTIAATMCNKIYPVGSIYMSINSTNPSVLFGGTWVAWGKGKVPVGVDTSQGSYNVVEKTGGSDSTVLSIANIPSHSHTYSSTVKPTGTVLSNTSINAAGDHSHTYSWSGTPSAGASTSVWVDGTSDLVGEIGDIFTDDSDGIHVSGRVSIANYGGYGRYSTSGTKHYNGDMGIMNFNHAHSAGASTSVWINPFTVSGTTSTSGSHSHSASTTSTFTGNNLTIAGTTSVTGSGTAIDNRQSYITCYMWKRIS